MRFPFLSYLTIDIFLNQIQVFSNKSEVGKSFLPIVSVISITAKFLQNIMYDSLKINDWNENHLHKWNSNHLEVYTLL